MIFFFLSSGLFLGWSLGANDAANVFESAVGTRMVKFKILRSISFGWVSTPIVAGIMAFFMLFFENNVFKRDVRGSGILVSETMNTESISEDTATNSAVFFNDSIQIEGSTTQTPVQTVHSENQKTKKTTEDNKRNYFPWIFAGIFLMSSWVLLYYFLRLKKASALLKKQLEVNEKKYILKIESLKKSVEEKIHKQDNLKKELKFKQSEMVTMAMNIIRKTDFLSSLIQEIIKIKSKIRDHDTRLALNILSFMITQDLSIDRDRDKFQMHINELNSNFIFRLSEAFPLMTSNEKRLVSLLRLGLSSKEIASILNISPKSVEVNRYRLRKKLKVDPKINLTDFIRDF